MFQTILQALVPVVFVVGLGWVVGRLGVLDPQRIRSITTFIVTVALPAALFAGVFFDGLLDFRGREGLGMTQRNSRGGG